MTPSQWEGALADGRVLYGRWRHGCGYIAFGADEDAVFDEPAAVEYVVPVGGNEWHGVMPDRQFIRLLKRVAIVRKSAGPPRYTRDPVWDVSRDPFAPLAPLPRRYGRAVHKAYTRLAALLPPEPMEPTP